MKRMFEGTVGALLLLASLVTLSCEASEDDPTSGWGSGDADTDGDADSDGDSDGDGDGDADTDGDGDTDGDTDGDGDGDPGQLDDDNDGLSNQYEEDNDLDPNDADTDDDGISDLAEVVAGTDPTDPESNPNKEGNFYFLEPFEEPPEPDKDSLVFSTDIQMADVFILQDTTGSMSMAITQLKRDLKTVIVPEVAAIIPDVWFGVGRFDDYPFGTYGGTTDKVFVMMQRTTDDVALAQAAVNKLKVYDGSDTPESHVPAMWATATGQGLDVYLSAATGCAAGEIGYPCFRQGAVPIVLLISDAPMHNGPQNYQPYSGMAPAPPTYDETVTALNDIHAKVIGCKVNPPFNIGGAIVKAHMDRIATDTGTVDAAGDPIVFTANMQGAGLGSDVVDAIALLANQVPMDVSAVARDDPQDSVDATVFIDRIEPNTTGGVADPEDAAVICVGGLSVVDTDNDSLPDEFAGVPASTPICFDIYPAQNDTVPPTAKPEVYTAFVDVIGDQNTVLDTREVYFLVPPSVPVVE